MGCHPDSADPARATGRPSQGAGRPAGKARSIARFLLARTGEVAVCRSAHSEAPPGGLADEMSGMRFPVPSAASREWRLRTVASAPAPQAIAITAEGGNCLCRQQCEWHHPVDRWMPASRCATSRKPPPTPTPTPPWDTTGPPRGASRVKLPQLRRPAATGPAADGLSPALESSAPHGARGSRLNMWPFLLSAERKCPLCTTLSGAAAAAPGPRRSGRACSPSQSSGSMP
jgi:hypothetical protein